MFSYFLVAGNLTEKILKCSVSKDWNCHEIIHSKNWGSKLKKKKEKGKTHQIHTSNDALISYRETYKNSTDPAKCLLNSSEGLHTMSFRGITQKLKARLKANVLL